jgi:flagellar biosynthesis anti-sigma factor FlgM
MRIDLNARTPEASDAGRPAKAGSRAAGSKSREAVGSDQAEVSLGQARTRALEVQAHRAPEIRQDKVEALARVIRDGTYEVSPEQTAEAMISEMLARSSVIR